MSEREADRAERRTARLAVVPALLAERDARSAAAGREWAALEMRIGRSTADEEPLYKTVPYMPPAVDFHPMRRLAAFH